MLAPAALPLHGAFPGSFDNASIATYNSRVHRKGAGDTARGPWWRSHAESRKRLSEVTLRDHALSYADIVLFFSGLVILAVTVGVAVHIGLLQKSALAQPPLPLQVVVVSISLILELNWIVRLLRGPPVWFLLGWR